MSAVPAPGLPDRVHDAQRSFRAALQALARPGRVQCAGSPIAGLSLGPAMAWLLLTLADDDTPVWWQQEGQALSRWLRFHTGAPVAQQPEQAAFAGVTDVGRMPPLDAFGAGSAAAPELSTTLLVEVATLQDGPRVQGHGPGIETAVDLRIGGLPAGFWSQWNANHARFPLGVDILFTCGDQVLGLPRTSRVRRLEEI